MHNERLKRIAKFLGTQGLYKEAGNLAKVAHDPFPGETGERTQIHEAYRAEGEEAIIKDLKAKVRSAIKKITAEEIEAIFTLGKDEVNQIFQDRLLEREDSEFARFMNPDEEDNYIIG